MYFLIPGHKLNTTYYSSLNTEHIIPDHKHLRATQLNIEH
jgi:hypothetical protein